MSATFSGSKSDPAYVGALVGGNLLNLRSWYFLHATQDALDDPAEADKILRFFSTMTGVTVNAVKYNLVLAILDEDWLPLLYTTIMK